MDGMGGVGRWGGCGSGGWCVPLALCFAESIDTAVKYLLNSIIPVVSK